MMRLPPIRRSSAGFTLVEMLIAMTMTAAVMGAAFSLFRSQSQALGANEQRYDQMQDARGTLEAASRLIRTMGAGVPNNQPVLVYGSNTALAFNTDFIEADTVDTRWAAYFNAQTPLAEAVSWDVSAATQIPTSTYTYPTANYLLGSGNPSPAETVILYFDADTSTARTDDYILWQRVNAGTPTMIARNILAHPSGLPFFQYMQEQVNNGNDTLITEPTAKLPLERRVLTSGITSSDSANYVRPDSVRAVRLNIRFTNGLSGTAERFRDVQTMVQTPNNGKPIPSVCGRAPMQPTGFAAIDTIPGSGRVWLSWNSSVDQDAGEVDVLQYIVYRKLAGATTWSDPLAVVRRIANQSSYTLEIGGNTPGVAYTFGVSAQDCTPSESTVTTLNITTSTGP